MKKIIAIILAIALVLCLCSCGGEETETQSVTYVLNQNTKKFHLVDCRYVSTIKASNKEISYKSRERLLSSGYTPCKTCHP